MPGAARRARRGLPPGAHAPGRAPERGRGDEVGGAAGVLVRAGDEARDLEALSARWRSAFDAAERALTAARFTLPAREVRAHAARLAEERTSTAAVFEALARDRGSRDRFVHLMIPRAQMKRLLGLPPDVTACVFNLDGVLIGSAAFHAAAWADTFGEFIETRIDRTGGRFAPFNPRTDYWLHIHAKPRLDGVRAFLASRGISLPEGTPDDPPGKETVHGLANRKNQALLRRLRESGVSRRYLELAQELGVQRAVVSASANTHTILERTGLAPLIEQCVDGNTMVAEHLGAKPGPDTLLAACRLLGVEPRHAAAFETSTAGVTAARAAGIRFVIAVDREGRAEQLRTAGADLVIPGLAELLDRNLAGRAAATS
jgi:beta-phosphoglucomutase-like phosphatase (HAD superfamily)